jgi:hypothetical protein
MRIRYSSLSFRIPVSRIKTTKSRKSWRLGGRHLHAAAPASKDQILLGHALELSRLREDEQKSALEWMLKQKLKGPAYKTSN